MNLKLLELFTYYLNLPLNNSFFLQFLSSALRKLTLIVKNQDIFIIKKPKTKLFFHFFRKKTSNVTSKVNADLSDNFFEALGTIHLRRRQIFTIFDPYPPTIGIPAKCL